jgi:hypothetical protein
VSDDTVNDDVDFTDKRAIPLESERPGVETGRSITSLSGDTIKRQYPQYVVKLSERREGIARGNAFKIAAGKG